MNRVQHVGQRDIFGLHDPEELFILGIILSRQLNGKLLQI